MIMEEFYELCRYCEQETKMVDFKVQKCEHCGRYIVPCAICPTPTNCKTCPLCAFADNLNNELDGYATTMCELVEDYNTRKGKEKTIRFKTIGGMRFILCYFEQENMSILVNENNEDKSQIWFDDTLLYCDVYIVLSKFIGEDVNDEYKVIVLK
jgi:hypothetical protein